MGLRGRWTLKDARTNLRIVERALELGRRSRLPHPGPLPRGEGPKAEGRGETPSRPRCGRRSRATTATTVSRLARFESGSSDLRAEVERNGTPVPRPQPKDGAPSTEIDERARRVSALMEALTADVPVEPHGAQRRATRPLASRASARLALAGNRRRPGGSSSGCATSTRRNLFDERAAIAGLRFVGRIGGTAKSPIDRYSYPAQDTDVRAEDELHLPDGTANFGKVEAHRPCRLVSWISRSVERRRRSIRQPCSHTRWSGLGCAGGLRCCVSPRTLSSMG